jgi:DNA invertase Pin-like site-specific DNA recombinase
MRLDLIVFPPPLISDYLCFGQGSGYLTVKQLVSQLPIEGLDIITLGSGKAPGTRCPGDGDIAAGVGDLTEYASFTILSISAQLRTVRGYDNRNGYEIVCEYVDDVESGRSASRPRFREIMAVDKLKNPPFQAILVWKFNRFSRSRIDSVIHKTLLQNKGIRVISINEPLDESPSGQLLEGIIESIYEFYSLNLGRDIKRGLRENAARGFYSIGRVLYGFHKVSVKDGAKTRYSAIDWSRSRKIQFLQK